MKHTVTTTVCIIHNLSTMSHNFRLFVDNRQDRDLSDSSNNVSDLRDQLKKSQDLISELRSSDAEMKRTNTESAANVAELKRDVEHLKSMSTLLYLRSCLYSSASSFRIIFI